MQQDTTQQLELTGVNGKRVLAVFDEPSVTSDFGALIGAGVEESVGIVRAISEALPDARRQSHVKHGQFEMSLQRVIQIMCGYWDADDCDHLKDDPALKTACDRKTTIWRHCRRWSPCRATELRTPISLPSATCCLPTPWSGWRFISTMARSIRDP